MQHDLKTWPKPFNSILGGRKKHEIRVNDRNFQEGDELFLREWNPDTKAYTGRHILALVSYLSKGGEWGIPDGLCVMSIRIQYFNIEATA